MKTQSLWEHTLTFFPQFAAALRERRPTGTIAVVGASDGKFVLPLAAAGYRVIAIERDPTALDGGEAELPGNTRETVPGLRRRLQAEGLEERVQIVESDFLAPDLLKINCDAIWTSCSWHYSANHHRPLTQFLTRMQDIVQPGGLFGAEFMMPVEPRHEAIEHYTTPDQVARHFDSEWDILLTATTGAFTERPHVGQLHDHTHRMGLVFAARKTTLKGAKRP